jgi:cation transport ATPase
VGVVYGINGSPALAQADVGIAVNGGTEVVQDTAHVALRQGNLWQIPAAIDIAHEGMVVQFWSGAPRRPRRIEGGMHMSFFHSVLTGFAFALGAFLVLPAIALVTRMVSTLWC